MEAKGTFVQQISDPVLQSDEPVNVSIFKEYERVIVQSLITSFGLDMFINDKYGGDVDTIHNVRQIGVNPNMTYKSESNQQTYNNRGEYSKASYHSDPRFSQMKHEARNKWQQDYQDINDQYQGGKIGFYGHTNSISPDRKAELDHVIECEPIHNDRGRVLAGLKGEDLANNPDNFAWTNKSLNASMGSWAHQKNEKYKREHNGQDIPMDHVSMKAYVEEHPELDEESKRRMLQQYEKSQKAYERRVNTTYYTSRKFYKDTSIAALKTGAKMGLRQALGFVFSEIWFSVKDEFIKAKGNAESLLMAVGNGIKKGLENAKQHYKEIWSLFIQGSIAGVLSSLTTTLCNIFFTTAKNIVRIIRQSWTSLVEATKIIIFNPDCLPFGERFRAGVKILATGASIVAGTMVSELISKTTIAAIPVVGDIVQTFCGTLVAGIISCTMLYVLDHNSIINKVINALNKIPTVEDIVRGYIIQGQLLEEYCAKLMKIDYDSFERQITAYNMAVKLLESAKSEDELNYALLITYEKLGIPSPYGRHKDIDNFMNDNTSVLKFE